MVCNTFGLRTLGFDQSHHEPTIDNISTLVIIIITKSPKSIRNVFGLISRLGQNEGYRNH